MTYIHKTVKAKVLQATDRKTEALDHITTEWQRGLELIEQCDDVDYDMLREETELPSSSCNAMVRHCLNGEQHPTIISGQGVNVWETDNKLTRVFCELFTGNTRIWLPLQMWEHHEDLMLDDDTEIKESKIISDGDDYYIHFTIRRKARTKKCESVIGVDLGDKKLATSVALSPDGSVEDVNFYGEEARGVRRHYAWLKKRLQEKGAYRTLKEIRHHEKRRIDDICHVISRRIVDDAVEKSAAIVIGDLHGIGQGDTGKGKRMNRIANEMPHHMLTRYITYKAMWEGVPVITADEAYTSQTCHTCNQIGNRKTQGCFECDHCGLQYNADANAAANIAQGFFDQWLKNGAVQPSAQKTAA